MPRAGAVLVPSAALILAGAVGPAPTARTGPDGPHGQPPQPPGSLDP